MCLMLFASGALAQEEDSNRVQALMDGIFACHLAQSGAENLQALLDSELAPKAGSGSEWMLFALGQTGDHDFSAACATLLDTISRTNVISAVTQQKYALVLKTMGSDDAFVQKAAQETVGAQGIMSWVYGLHLLNNGCAGSMTAEQAVQQLLALQLADGGWALRGEVSDVDVTAMTMQALAPHMQQAEVAQSLERAVALLSARQLDSGDYVSYGKPNPESAAQVVIALSAMGIDAFKDERFIKNGSTLLDVISHYRLEDGSFCHVEGGDSNANATVQVLHSMIAWQRMHAGEGSLYRIAPKQLVKPTAKLGYKSVAMIVIAAAAALICLVLFVLGKRSLKNYLAVLLFRSACGKGKRGRYGNAVHPVRQSRRTDGAGIACGRRDACACLLCHQAGGYGVWHSDRGSARLWRTP